jgi:hypothetical protein
MPVVRRCASAPRPVHARRGLRRAEDALTVLLAGGGATPPAIGCLLLDERHRGLLAVDVVGRAGADAVLDVAEVMLAASAQHAEMAAVVLASFRDGADHLPEAGDEATFAELRDLFDDAGIELLDWFLVAGGYATSLAELTGTTARWKGPA